MFDGALHVGGKLPVLQEDIKEEKESAQRSSAGGASDSRWWSFGKCTSCMQVAHVRCSSPCLGHLWMLHCHMCWLVTIHQRH